MAGVYPGTEHPQVSFNLDRIYNERVTYCHDSDWHACLRRLSGHLEQGMLPLICVLNKACRHIPGSGSAEPLSHYLIATKIEAGRLFFFDSFLNRSGSLPLETLPQAMQFDTAEGERIVFRSAHLQYDRPYRSTHRLAEKEAGDIFFPPPPGIPAKANEKDRVTYGIQAMRELLRHLQEMDRPLLRSSLKPLCESFRYVQYQRKYFTESLRDIINLFPRHERTCITIMDRSERIADDWFRLKITMLYNLRKELPQLLAGLAPQLDELSLKEEQAMKELQQLRRSLMTAA